MKVEIELDDEQVKWLTLVVAYTCRDNLAPAGASIEQVMTSLVAERMQDMAWWAEEELRPRYSKERKQ